MPKRQYRTPLACKKATEAKLRRVGHTIEEAVEVVRKDLREDLIELTSGQPSGKERRAQLRKAGHPFGRRATKDGSKTFGRQRGSLPTLPISGGSGRLQKSIFAVRGGTRVIAGFGSNAGPSIYVVLPSGTSKMVGRGLWGPNEGGEMGKRVKARRKAVEDAIFGEVKR